VYFNGNPVGGCEGPLNPFWVELPTDVVDKPLPLAVRVEHDRIDLAGGMVRGVDLVVTGAVYIAAWRCRAYPTDNYSTAHIDLSFEVVNSLKVDQYSTMFVAISDGQREAFAKQLNFKAPKGSVTITESLDLPADQTRLWSPDTPHLYTMQAVLKRMNYYMDGVSDAFGVREVQLRPGGLHLNGRPFCFMGTKFDEWRGLAGYCVGDSVARNLVALAKEAGFNTIYCEHPLSQAVLRWADHLGLGVIQAITDENVEAVSQRLRWHPCVLAYAAASDLALVAAADLRSTSVLMRVGSGGLPAETLKGIEVAGIEPPSEVAETGNFLLADFGAAAGNYAPALASPGATDEGTQVQALAALAALVRGDPVKYAGLVFARLQDSEFHPSAGLISQGGVPKRAFYVLRP
jgi:hypothetical protein